MKPLLRLVIISVSMTAPLWAQPAGAEAQPNIGSVDVVRIWAYGTPVGVSKRDLLVKDAVFGNERVETVRDGALHLRFVDDTVFRLGSNSSAVLDKFVFDPDTGTGEIALSLSKGLFRYVSGILKGPAVTIRTPTATIGLRGSDTVICVSTGLKDPICPGPVGTTKVWPKVGQAILKSIADATTEAVAAGAAGGVEPDGSAKPSEDPVPPADGIGPGQGFETKSDVQTQNTGGAEGSEGLQGNAQTPAAVSPASGFGGPVQTALLSNPVVQAAAISPAAGPDGFDSLDSFSLVDGVDTVDVVTTAVANQETVIGEPPPPPPVGIIASQTHTITAAGPGTAALPNRRDGRDCK